MTSKIPSIPISSPAIPLSTSRDRKIACANAAALLSFHGLNLFLRSNFSTSAKNVVSFGALGTMLAGRIWKQLVAADLPLANKNPILKQLIEPKGFIATKGLSHFLNPSSKAIVGALSPLATSLAIGEEALKKLGNCFRAIPTRPLNAIEAIPIHLLNLFYELHQSLTLLGFLNGWNDQPQADFFKTEQFPLFENLKNSLFEKASNSQPIQQPSPQAPCPTYTPPPPCPKPPKCETPPPCPTCTPPPSPSLNPTDSIPNTSQSVEQQKEAFAQKGDLEGLLKLAGSKEETLLSDPWKPYTTKAIDATVTKIYEKATQMNFLEKDSWTLSASAHQEIDKLKELVPDSFDPSKGQPCAPYRLHLCEPYFEQAKKNSLPEAHNFLLLDCFFVARSVFIQNQFGFTPEQPTPSEKASLFVRLTRNLKSDFGVRRKTIQQFHTFMDDFLKGKLADFQEKITQIPFRKELETLSKALKTKETEETCSKLHDLEKSNREFTKDDNFWQNYHPITYRNLRNYAFYNPIIGDRIKELKDKYCKPKAPPPFTERIYKCISTLRGD